MRVGPHPMTVSFKRRDIQTYRHGEKDTMWRQTQRLERRVHRTRDSQYCLKPPWAGGEASTKLSSRAHRKSWSCLHPDFRFRLQNCEQIHFFVVIGYLVCSHLSQRPEETNTGSKYVQVGNLAGAWLSTRKENTRPLWHICTVFSPPLLNSCPGYFFTDWLCGYWKSFPSCFAPVVTVEKQHPKQMKIEDELRQQAGLICLWDLGQEIRRDVQGDASKLYQSAAFPNSWPDSNTAYFLEVGPHSHRYPCHQRLLATKSLQESPGRSFRVCVHVQGRCGCRCVLTHRCISTPRCTFPLGYYLTRRHGLHPPLLCSLGYLFTYLYLYLQRAVGECFIHLLVPEWQTNKRETKV